jgi:membrane-bound lytic murein transglycosylase D
MFGLHVSSYIDERCNPYKATVAAAEYLKSLYNMFGDWQMVLAAYNAGPGTISKAIRRSGGKKTYWEIRPYLPLETQGYVPAFIAANYVMNHGPEHNIYPAIPRKTYFEVDTVVVKEPMSFDQISQALNVSVEEILYFNPQYRKNIIPSGGHVICLPKDKIGVFLNNEQAIYASVQSQQKGAELVVAEVRKTHTVRSGEKLSTIARQYGVTVAELRSWNYIGSKGIQPGKKLTVYVREQKREAKALPKQTETPQVAASSGEGAGKQLAENTGARKDVIYYKVRKGDSLYGIAKQYGVDYKEIKDLNNLKSNQLMLGQTLKIRVKG